MFVSMLFCKYKKIVSSDLWKKEPKKKGSNEPWKSVNIIHYGYGRHPWQHNKNCCKSITDGEELKNS